MRRQAAASEILKLAVTTCYDPGPAHLERARSIAERLQVPLLERLAWEKLFEQQDITHLYVVTRAHDEVRDAGENTCFVQEGLLASKLTTGRTHPYVRAVLGGTAEQPVASVFDGTLGLANDALHLATVLECAVRGVEGSPVLHALLEEGLPRLARTYPHAARITLVHSEAIEALRAAESASFDVVTLDPMMSRAKKSAPSFSLLRDFALPDRATPELLGEAARVARKRVVLKLGKGAPLPPECPLRFALHERGAHVTYWVHDCVAR